MAKKNRAAAPPSKQRKPKREAAKKPGKKKDADMTEFRAQLDSLGLKIVQVDADGNCFFRAMGDQLEGNEEQHMKYRKMVVEYIAAHREEFEPFIEDEVPFEKYCSNMLKDGTWAGNIELQAASLVLRRNICIHTLDSPRLYINNFAGHEATSTVNLSYHNGEHYNSVRLREDSCLGPAMPYVDNVDNGAELRQDENGVVEQNDGTSSSKDQTAENPKNPHYSKKKKSRTKDSSCGSTNKQKKKEQAEAKLVRETAADLGALCI